MCVNGKWMFVAICIAYVLERLNELKFPVVFLPLRHSLCWAVYNLQFRI